jgi:N-acetylmuramoyl-L-alanine amidase
LTTPNGDKSVSAHLVIGRDGSITQLVAFDRVAWHAGISRWGNLTGLNQFSLGIELDNAGKLERQGGRWRAWFGQQYDDSEVLEAVHKNGGGPAGWHLYPPKQIEATLEVGQLLVNHYHLLDVLGHDDISPGRKVDPGPAFPMASFRSRLFGRKLDEAPRYETTANLNIRSGPGTEFPTLPGSPLPEGTQVEALDQQDIWWQVDVLDVVNDVMDIQGWVHSRFLKRIT